MLGQKSGGGFMRKLAILSVILIVTVTLVLGGCGVAPPPAVQKPSWRERAKHFAEMDKSTFTHPAEVADYPELTEAAALELFLTCQTITGIGFSQDEWPVNVVKSFNTEEFCNVYTVADSWLFLDVRTSDARIIHLKNVRAGQAPAVVQGLSEVDALARAETMRASLDEAEEVARQASQGVAERQQLAYEEPVTRGQQVTSNTGCWGVAWARTETAGIPYHSWASYPGEGIRLTQRVDGLFLEYMTQETVACDDTQPVIAADAAQETAQPVIDEILAHVSSPVPASTVSLAYVIPGPVPDIQVPELPVPIEPEFSHLILAYPNEFRLAWVVAVGPHPWHTELNWVEVWVDALNGEIIGIVRNDLLQ